MPDEHVGRQTSRRKGVRAFIESSGPGYQHASGHRQPTNRRGPETIGLEDGNRSRDLSKGGDLASLRRKNSAKLDPPSDRVRVIAAVYTIAVHKPITRPQITFMASPTPEAAPAKRCDGTSACCRGSTDVHPDRTAAGRCCSDARAPLARTSAATPAAQAAPTPSDQAQDIHDKPVRSKRSSHNQRADMGNDCAVGSGHAAKGRTPSAAILNVDDEVCRRRLSLSAGTIHSFSAGEFVLSVRRGTLKPVKDSISGRAGGHRKFGRMKLVIPVALMIVLLASIAMGQRVQPARPLCKNGGSPDTFRHTRTTGSSRFAPGIEPNSRWPS